MVQVHPPLPDPPPATPTRPDPLDLALGRALDREAPARGERWLIAFSGGPDSTALAAALAPLAARRGLRLTLAHVDHGLDEDSPRRADEAARIATRLGLEFEQMLFNALRERRRRESPEAAARRLRYAALERLRAKTGSARILTAHHRDDQVETILLKLLRGAAVERLGGIAERRGRLLRPLLGVTREEIEARLSDEGIDPVRDPTNDDLATPRNRLRRHLLPRLRAAEPEIDAALLALARRADRVRHSLHRIFQSRYPAETTSQAFIEGKDRDGSGAAPDASGATPSPALPPPWKPLYSQGEAAAQSCDGEGAKDHPALSAMSLVSLPEPLQLPALRWLLTRRLGVGQLPSLPSMKAFLSLLSRGRDADLRLPGDSRALAARRGRLELAAAESRTPPFTYTFLIPGEVELPELGQRLRIRRAPVEPWMFRGEMARVGLKADAAEATVRSRRSGDRLRPLGSPGSRKLKAVLIDRGVPADARDRLPLLEIAGELAWIPGITIGDGFALAEGDRQCWLAELEPLAERAAGAAGEGERTTTT